MSTFAKSTFNALVYSASRPTYPTELFEHIFAFHRAGKNAQWERAADLGCGTGQATLQLHPFKEVLGVEPSAGMLEKARAYAASKVADPSKFKFVQGSAEDTSKAIAENSADLIVAAQAAHWFDWSKVWPETYRALRPGGTVAFWIYAEFRLPQFPTLGEKITAYAQGTDPKASVGSHFQRPGRTILERHLVDVPEPSEFGVKLEPLHRVFFCGDEVPPFVPKESPIHPVLMRTEMRWRDLLAYFRTWSALHTYHERYPEDLTSPEDTRFLEEDLSSDSEDTSKCLVVFVICMSADSCKGDVRGGDIAIRFWKDLREGAAKTSPGATVGINDVVRVEWPVALIMTRKSC
ncbi:Trans-aconitate 3-methyltransferase [Psilocybe cubensis]|uniref:Methyltransferase type 11 domain-containing protein n=2 Tax=Psilocybe cubensis TaxID=181762 RepID=A0A8H7XN70_PSICU|nr:Trans-aconitate 3-methyltransferase [Psilocybe cubensis]KAH9476268.1 Trans-aconitate 3-methyltransferase [Psilocybe cubensis]